MSEDKEKYVDRMNLLVPINSLAPQHQVELLAKAEILQFKRRQYVFKQGDRDSYAYYLLEGKLDMYSDDQLIKQVEGGTAAAYQPLAQLQPRQLSAQAKTKIVVLRVNRTTLDQLLTLDQQEADQAPAVEVKELDEEEDSGDWLGRMLQSELFEKIPPSNIQKLLSTMESVEFKKGDYVVKQGDLGDYYYVVQSGRCEVVRESSETGNEVVLAQLRPGDSFGEEALITGSKRNASVRMLGNGELVRLTKDDFIELITKPVMRSVTHAKAEELVESGKAVWVDVRQADEFAGSGIEGALNLPLNQMRAKLEDLPTDKTYITYCDTGGRSSAAAFLMAERGFDVCYVAGGYLYIPEIAATPKAPPAEELVPVSQRAATETTRPPEPAEEAEEEIDYDVRASVLTAELGVADMQLEEAEKLQADVASAQHEAARRDEEKRKAEQARKQAEQAEEERRKAEQARIEAERLAEEHRQAAERAKLAAKRLEEEQRKDEEAKREAKQREEAEQQAARKRAEQQLAEEQKLKAEREKINAEAKKAAAMIEEAKRLRQQIEAAKREAEAEAEKRRQEQEAEFKRMREAAEQRLRDEEARLQEVYQRNAEELQEARRLREEAERKLEEERAALAEKSKETGEIMKAAKAKEARLQKEAQRLLEEYRSKEQDLQQAAAGKIAAERKRLEAEFVRTAAELEEAQRERAAAQAARQAAQEEAEQIIAEYKAAHEKQQAAAQAKLEAEREQLRKEAEKISSSLAEAKKAQEEAARAKQEAEMQQKDLVGLVAQHQGEGSAAMRVIEAKIKAELEAIQAREEEAAQQLHQAEEAQLHIEEQQKLNVEEIERVKEVGEQMSEQLHAELDDWLSEQEKLQETTFEREKLKEQIEISERIKNRAAAARAESSAHDQALLDELAEFMDSDDD